LASINDNFTTQLMSDMSPALLDFIKNKINSFIKWDLVKFFYQNPNTTDTTENIAKYIGRNEESVQSELEALVENNVLFRALLGKTVVYSLANDNTTRALIEQFIQACGDRHFRIKAVYHILRGRG